MAEVVVVGQRGLCERPLQLLGCDALGEGAADLGHGGVLVLRLDGGDQGVGAVGRPRLAVGIGVFPQGVVAEVADDLDQGGEALGLVPGVALA